MIPDAMRDGAPVAGPSAGLRIGVDVGGTFTDLVAVDLSDGAVHRGKLLTTPADPIAAILDGLGSLLTGVGRDFSSVATIVHGTTRAGNALIERKGGVVGLLTTDGFRDVLEMGNEMRYDLYDLSIRRAEPLVIRSRRRGVSERMDSSGSVRIALDEAQVVAEADRLVADGVESIAICFLHAYANARHELRAAELIRERHPMVHLTVSHAAASELREFERFSTAVANAYIVPVMDPYLAAFERRLREIGFTGDLVIMLSSGGIATLEVSRAMPIHMVESGPAGGILAARHAGSGLQGRDLLAFDMGGTTAKLSVLAGGEPRRSHALEVARVHRFKRGSGLPLRLPVVDLVEIGAGGGSQAWIDGMGLLKVGPESSGADPGPACYGRGGTEPTVTDADLVLGILNPANFLGGRLGLDVGRARRAIDDRIASRLGIGTVEAARGMFTIVTENMAQAARMYLAERGVDPRRYTLVASGGAGPVHGYEVARRLKMPRVLYPFGAGVASALGFLVAPASVEVVRSAPTPLDGMRLPGLRLAFDAMRRQALEGLQALGVEVDDVRLSWSVDMRYMGQGFEVNVPLEAGIQWEEAHLAAAFAQAYDREYGRSIAGVPIEVMAWRLAASGPTPQLAGEARASARSLDEARLGVREVHLMDGEPLRCQVYDRYALAQGACIVGPAIVEERESTIFIGPAGTAAVDDAGNLLVEIAAA